MKPIIIRNVVPRRLVENALRAINMRVYEHGLTVEESHEWAQSSCWFPDLCSPEHPTLTELWERAARALRPPEHEERWTQIILQVPVLGTAEVQFHRDDPPPDGRQFTFACGATLTPASPWYGGLQFPAHDPIFMEPGDVIQFDPNELHTGGRNQSGALRYVVYFRTLA